jgi:carboxymethylenebutenolidase
MANPERVTFPSSAGEASGVFITPGGTPAGVVLIHEWWGVNEQIQNTAKRYVEEGFAVIVPDLYHGKTAKDATEAGEMMNKLDFGKAAQEIAGAVQFLRDKGSPKVAVTGYCMGGALTLASAVNIPGLAAVVPFYGWPGDLDWTKIEAPIQAHFAQHDEWAKVSLAQKVKNAVKVPMELHVYDAQHAFCNEKRPEVYNADAAKQSWNRTVAFIRSHTK